MKRLLILSGKGGTGKTTVAAAFIRFSNAKAAADCDVDAPNLHLVFPQKAEPERWDFLGGEKAVIDPEQCIGCGRCEETCRFQAIEKRDSVFSVNEYSCEGCGVCVYVCPQKAVVLKPDAAGSQELYLGDQVFSTAMLKMGRGNSGKLVTNVKKAMLKHAKDAELAIIDGSPGIGCPVISSVSGMDLVLVVAEPSMSGLSDLKRLVKTAETFQTPLAVCVNKYQVCPEKAEEIRQFCQEHQLFFTGFLPFDNQAAKAVNEGRSVADVECPLRDALKQVYEETIRILNL